MRTLVGMLGTIQRLQDRYPDALFIYVDLYTLIRPRNPKLQVLISKVEEDVGAHIYSFPTTTSEDAEEKAKLEWLYAEDKHHINHEGHKLVRDNVERIISEADNLGHGMEVIRAMIILEPVKFRSNLLEMLGSISLTTRKHSLQLKLEWMGLSSNTIMMGS